MDDLRAPRAAGDLRRLAPQRRRRRVAGAYDTWVNRLAGALAVPLAASGLTPNQVTVLGGLVGLGAGVVFATAGWAGLQIGALLFMGAIFLDELDGALARYQHRTSRTGYILDYLVGTSSFCALFVGLGVGFARMGGGQWMLALGLAAAVSALVSMAVRMRVEDKRGSAAVQHPRFAGFELKDGIYLIGPITWIGALEWFFILSAACTCLYALLTLLGALRLGVLRAPRWGWGRRRDPGGSLGRKA